MYLTCTQNYIHFFMFMFYYNDTFELNAEIISLQKCYVDCLLPLSGSQVLCSWLCTILFGISYLYPCL